MIAGFLLGFPCGIIATVIWYQCRRKKLQGTRMYHGAADVRRLGV